MNRERQRSLRTFADSHLHQILSRALDLRPGTLPLAILVLALVTFYGITNWLPKPPPKPDSTWVHILEEGTFRVGIDPSFPPFEMDDGKGRLSGLDIALAEALVQTWSAQHATPLRIQYVYTGFDGLYDALKAGQFDAILSALPYDPKRTEDVQFSHAYYNGGPLVIVRETDAHVNSWSDLAQRRIGVELGSSGDSFARKWQRRLRYELVEFNSPEEALHVLTLGQVDGVFTDGIAFTDFARVERGVKTVGKPLTDELFVIAVRKDAATLLQEINGVIDAMKQDGRMDDLQRQWF